MNPRLTLLAFFLAPVLLCLLIAAWKQIRTIVTTGVLLLVTSLCGVGVQAGQSNGEPELASYQAASSKTNLLGLPYKVGPTVVRAAFHLQDIVEIDDEAETFQFTGVLTLTWKDKRQAFDPDKQQVQESIYQGDYQFNEISPSWYPQVVLASESGMYEVYGVLLRVQPDGTSTLIQTVSAISEANFNVRRYPFDTQHLEAVFQIHGFDSSEVVFEVDPKPVDSYWKELEISQWKLVGIRHSMGEQVAPYAGNNGASSTFTVGIEVQRRPFYIVRLVVIPLALIVILSWAVFWMERSSLGDRISVSFIGILTAITYQIVISDLLPHESYVTLINGFVNLSLLVMCATVVVNLTVGAYDKQGKSELGDRIDYHCRWMFPLVYFSLLLLMVAVSLIYF